MNKEKLKLFLLMKYLKFKELMKLQEVLQLAKELSPIDKVRLIQKLTPDLEQELASQKPQPYKIIMGFMQRFRYSTFSRRNR